MLDVSAMALAMSFVEKEILHVPQEPSVDEPVPVDEASGVS